MRTDDTYVHAYLGTLREVRPPVLRALTDDPIDRSTKGVRCVGEHRFTSRILSYIPLRPELGELL